MAAVELGSNGQQTARRKSTNEQIPAADVEDDKRDHTHRAVKVAERASQYHH